MGAFGDFFKGVHSSVFGLPELPRPQQVQGASTSRPGITVSSGPPPSAGQTIIGGRVVQLPETRGPQGSFSTGGGGGGGAPSPGVQQQIQGAFEQAPEAPSLDFNALIQPAIEALGQAESAAQSAFSAQESDIQRQTKKAKGEQEQFLSSQEKQAARDISQQRGLKEDALNQSRRAAAEIQQGIQSRFGGTTGTGKFASEIVGRETLRNMAKARSSFQGAVQAISDKIEDVRIATNLALQDLDEQKNVSMQRAKAFLQQSLSDIRLRRGELLSRKAEMVQRALENHRNLVSQVEARNAQFRQSLAKNALQAEQRLRNAQQRAMQKQSALEELISNAPQIQKLTTGNIFGQELDPTIKTRIGRTSIELRPKKKEETSIGGIAPGILEDINKITGNL